MRIIIIYIILLNFSVFSQESPREPELPEIKEEVPEKKEEKRQEAKKKGKSQINLSLKLCDGRSVKGSFEYEKEELNLKHLKDGIFYEKTLKVSELRKIFIHSWEGVKLKKNKEGFAYKFEPRDISLFTMDGAKYKIRGMIFGEFSKLILKNQNGTATLYSYWMDLRYENGKWYTGLPIFKGNEREDCHSDVVRIIQFESEDD
jgi:hypothetical protein